MRSNASMMEKYPILSKINSIEQFKSLSSTYLEPLAEEIRSFLVDSVSENGGHLASNLGVVELTIALHRVFDVPEDSLIFDVGHQAYIHKILTGRRDGFKRLRRLGGISGFPKRSESPCDIFETGHSSTSVSAALGILCAKRLKGEKGAVVAVIGDGALTGGMAYEALDDAGQRQLPIIVVINDNDMSISYNASAMSKHLNLMRASRGYRSLKKSTVRILDRTRVGKWAAKRIEKFKNRLKYFMLPSNIWFEAMGFTYIGPVDGHNIHELLEVLGKAKGFDKPVAIHVVTKKGKGYPPAERDPELFHGVAPFYKETGALKRKPSASNSKIFGEELSRLAGYDPRICAITAAMASGTGLSDFFRLYPDRFFDVGIAEQHAVTLAAGLAAGGMRPVAAIYSTFLQRAYDQIIHDVCLQQLPVILAVDRAGLVGEDGETHQGVYDIAYLLSAPGITIYSPASQEELRMMLRHALTLDKPSAIRYNRGVLIETLGINDDIEYGRWNVLREIKNVNVIATGRLVQTALEAAEGLSVGVINARFIRPLDRSVLDRLIESSDVIITLEDGITTCGFGALIAQAVCGKAVRLVNLGVMDHPVGHATVSEQDEICGLTAKQIRRRLKEALDTI